MWQTSIVISLKRGSLKNYLPQTVSLGNKLITDMDVDFVSSRE